MKIKYIIGTAIGLVFVVVALLSFNSSKIEYADFSKAKDNGKIVQVIGSWDKSQPYDYNTRSNEFKFSMIDENGNKTNVISNHFQMKE